MKVKFLRSATAIIETSDARILMDPWLIDGAYYGSWSHFPAYQWDDADFAGLTHIYVSHVHPDHFDKATMLRLDKRLPVLIHRFHSPFLKSNIEALGFKVIELAHSERYEIGDTDLAIYAADDCDPDVCGKFFSCKALLSTRGSTQIDSLIEIGDRKHRIINTNDCPYPLAKHVIDRIPSPDLLMTSYGAAGPFPQCFANLSHVDKVEQAEKLKWRMLDQAISFARHLKPALTFPFAGQYVLSGRLASLNQYLGLPEVDEIHDRMEQADIPTVKIMRGATYDLATGKSDLAYVPIDVTAKKNHIRDVLSSRPFEYDDDPGTSPELLDDLVRRARERLESKRKEQLIVSPTTVIANGYELPMGDIPDGSYIKMDVEPKLFARIMRGPKFAHWNNAEIGSHIRYDRKPDVFDRGIDNLMSFFHG
jgi:UDP-MurNAc hydroxylase